MLGMTCIAAFSVLSQRSSFIRSAAAAMHTEFDLHSATPACILQLVQCILGVLQHPMVFDLVSQLSSPMRFHHSHQASYNCIITCCAPAECDLLL